MTHEERAEQLFLEGYNCAQATAAAFAEEMGLSVEQVARMASSFGGGLGRLREVCGCVSGMALAAGMLYGYSDPKAVEEKMELYALIQELAGKFREENGSYICRELLEGVAVNPGPAPELRTEQYYHHRPCAKYAACAARILEEKMKELEEKK